MDKEFNYKERKCGLQRRVIWYKLDLNNRKIFKKNILIKNYVWYIAELLSNKIYRNKIIFKAAAYRIGKNMSSRLDLQKCWSFLEIKIKCFEILPIFLFKISRKISKAELIRSM